MNFNVSLFWYDRCYVLWYLTPLAHKRGCFSMETVLHSVDEYTMAAFMAGTLSDEEHEAVIAYLSENAEARELLCMAHEALEAATIPEPQPIAPPLPAQHSRPAQKPGASKRWMQLTGAAVLVFALGFGLRLTLAPPTSLTRDDVTPSKTTLTVDVSPALDFQWTAIPDAYKYKVVIWDARGARVVAEHETNATRLSDSDPFVQTLSPILDASQHYTLRIDAIDARNRLIESSELVSFRVRQ